MEVFGWIESSAGLAKIKLRGRSRVDAALTMAPAATPDPLAQAPVGADMSVQGNEMEALPTSAGQNSRTKSDAAHLRSSQRLCSATGRGAALT